MNNPYPDSPIAATYTWGMATVLGRSVPWPLDSNGPISPYDPTYPWVGPMTQYSAVDSNGLNQVYQLDERMNIYSQWNDTVGAFGRYQYQIGKMVPAPDQFTLVFKASDVTAVANKLMNQSVVSAITNYIIIGDEPASMNSSSAVINLKVKLSDSQYDGMKQLMKMMPREYLRDWFDAQIRPSLPNEISPVMSVTNIYGTKAEQPKQFEDMIWGAIINLFNEANLEYVNANAIDPWDWEQQKLDAYYMSQNKDALANLQMQFNLYQEAAAPTDPVAYALIQDFNSLPKLGDVGLEINRQMAIQQLLAKKEYVSVKAIIDAYKYIDADPDLGPLISKPVPQDVNLGDITIKATPPSDVLQ